SRYLLFCDPLRKSVGTATTFSLQAGFFCSPSGTGGAGSPLAPFLDSFDNQTFSTALTVFAGAIMSARALRLRRMKTASAAIIMIAITAKTPITAPIGKPSASDVRLSALGSLPQLSVALAGKLAPLNMYLPLSYSLH
ncbi:hypothetical protein PFISCL1PPCAC_9041, partial [Pristionchus fissidentatus]